MRKIIILVLFLFFSLIYSASSLKIFEINETGKMSLGLKVEDPDADMLDYAFSEPLNEDGEWQTTYGDAGEYEATITVSDGNEIISENILIIVNRKEEKPSIEKASPEETEISIDEGESVKFGASAYDLNKDALEYNWMVDGQSISQKEEMVFETNYADAGQYKVLFIASDGISNASREWIVEVKDVNLDDLLDKIKDVEIFETETAKLNLPDFNVYGLEYSISDPIGQDNIWETGYDDAGEYDVKIKVEGNGFEGKKDIGLVVKNKDRAPKILELGNFAVNENEEIKIEVKVSDPDNDKIMVSAEDLPEGASFEDLIFTWTPGHDFVGKNSVFDYLLDKFRMLSRSIEVVFKVQSNELSDEEKVKITVKDMNRPFVLEKIKNIEVNEGEEIVISQKYTNPDNNKVSFSYSGFMDSSRKRTDFDDSGLYIVKVVATDGISSQTQFVNIKVNDANRKPSFAKIKDSFKVLEGEELKFALNAEDEDNDAISFFASNLPDGAELKDNLFVWKPQFDVVNGTEKEFAIDFIAFDGKDEDQKKIKIYVGNVNQAPKIISASNTLIAVKGKPILFEINAVDIDNDELTYGWDFGFFDKFKGKNTHQRIFTTKGKKTVEVTVSDGIESVSKAWEVEVV